MKILFLARLYWPHGGGVEKHVEKLSEQFIKRGDTVVLVTEQYDQDLAETETHKGVLIYRIPYFAISSKLSLWTWMEKHISLFDEADVVHVHDVFWWYWPIWAMRLLKPVYITFHGYEGNDLPTKKAVMWRKTAETLCRGSMCIGSFMRKWYLASPDIISYGAADNKRLPEMKDETAVFLGRYDEDTGVLVYAEVAKKIKRLQRSYFYGDGPQKQQLVNMISSNKKISVFPWTQDVSSAMKKGKYVFVSRYLGILEAMQAGKLVVAVYNNQIKRDYLECHPMRDNMLIAADAKELICKLEKIMNAPEEERLMIERAYNWAQKQTWQKLMGEYERLWEK
jgi:glycosyltransferase involved in cell wall biosynthesis